MNTKSVKATGRRLQNWVRDKLREVYIKNWTKLPKLKEDDIKAYDWWQEIMPITMFIYSTTEQNHKLMAYRELRELALEGKTGRYPDNNKLYYEIPWDTI